MTKLTAEVLTKIPGFSGIATFEGFSISGGKVHHTFGGTYDFDEVACILSDMTAIRNALDSGELERLITAEAKGKSLREARELGYNAGCRVAVVECPYGADTDEAKSWRAGCMEAQA
jgi:hypothetical protein